MSTNTMMGRNVTATRDASGNVTGLSAGNGKAIIATTHEPPAGFSVPTALAGIYAYRFGDKWHCNIGPDDLIDASGITATYYVDPVGGSDSNSGLTWALRKKSIGATMRAAETAESSARILLYAANGPFWRQVGFSDNGSVRNNTHTIVVESICGRAQVCIADNLSYTIDGTYTNTYTAARTNALRAVNYSRLDADGLPTVYTTVASETECNATAGTFYTNGTSVWVRPHGDEAPTLKNCMIVISAVGAEWESNANLLLRNIDFIGGNTGAFRASGGSTNIVVADNCTFGFGHTATAGNYIDSCDINDVGLFAAFNSKAIYGQKDGFNLTTTSSVTPAGLFVNCEGWNNGLTGSQSNNGFTSHTGVMAVSIGCKWLGSHGANSAHVNDNTQIWSVGDVAGASAGDRITGGTIDRAGFAAWSGAAKLWLDSCQDVGCDVGVYAGDGAAVYLRNHKGSGQRTGNVSAY